MELCNWLDISMIEGAICSDHVHMYLFSSSEIFSVPCDESPQGEECGVSAEGLS
jgi:hypothetical protein